jgi:hypothetical protein
MHEKNTDKTNKKIEQFVNEALAYNKKHNIFVRESTKRFMKKMYMIVCPSYKKLTNQTKY